MDPSRTTPLQPTVLGDTDGDGIRGGVGRRIKGSQGPGVTVGGVGM